MREALEELGIIDRELRRLKDNITGTVFPLKHLLKQADDLNYIIGFASRIPRVVLGSKSKHCRHQILVDFGFEELKDCEETVFLDLAVVDLGGEQVILDILSE